MPLARTSPARRLRRPARGSLPTTTGITNFYLESNFATDKKSSQINILRTRGKRVVAEATIPAALIEEQMHTSSEKLFRARQVSQLGGFMSGVNNNGLQSANGIAALFIATGQDAANVAESSAALGFSELLPNGDYYGSITLPSLIVATYGGGTGLATQRECLELLGCYGTGKVRKLAEIVAATVLCGELSLGWAIVVAEWVSAHDLLRPQPALARAKSANGRCRHRGAGQGEQPSRRPDCLD